LSIICCGNLRGDKKATKMMFRRSTMMHQGQM
jgi:hypothetical protein